MDDQGISHEGELLDVGVELGILTKSGAFIKWNEIMLGQGRAAAISFLKENKKDGDRLDKEIRDAWTKQASGKEMVVGKEEDDEAVVAEEKG
jgi:recombination protein RecA